MRLLTRLRKKHMKNLLKVVSIIGLTVITQTAYSAKVTDTFTTGDTLTAEKLNNIKSAVNDNDTRISGIVLTPGPAGADSTVAGPKGDTGADSTVAGPPGPAGLVGAVAFDSAPTATDDMNTYTLGTFWIDTSAATAYILVDNSPSAAVWTTLGSPTTYSIGDTGPAGGIVFHTTNGGLHGLEAAAVNQASAWWGCEGTTLPGANGTAVGTGKQNTADIIAACVGTTARSVTAASVAAAYGDGWYLPSKDELNLLYSQKITGVVGGFGSYYYWSSSQGSSGLVLVQGFGSGVQFEYPEKDYPLSVRAVRDF
jgi:hypothetical protein